MNIHQINSQQFVLSNLAKADVNISAENKSLSFNALTMFVASLGRCTYVILAHYAMRLDKPVRNIRIDMHWQQSGHKPAHINQIDMTIYWPELPKSRIKAIQRATRFCTVHNTISNCVKINTTVSTDQN